MMILLEMQNAAHGYSVVPARRAEKKRHDHPRPEDQPPAITTNLTAPSPPPPPPHSTKNQSFTTSQPSCPVALGPTATPPRLYPTSTLSGSLPPTPWSLHSFTVSSATPHPIPLSPSQKTTNIASLSGNTSWVRAATVDYCSIWWTSCCRRFWLGRSVTEGRCWRRCGRGFGVCHVRSARFWRTLMGW